MAELRRDSLLVAGCFVLMVASNVAANKKVFGGSDNKTLSDENPTFLTPDGKTFAVWGIIYMLQIAMVVAQLVPTAHMDQILAMESPITGLDGRKGLLIVFLANAIWLPVFNNSFFFLAFAIMLVYLGALISVYSTLNVVVMDTFLEGLLLAAPIATNLSWIIVATSVASLFVGARSAGRTKTMSGARCR